MTSNRVMRPRIGGPLDVAALQALSGKGVCEVKTEVMLTRGNDVVMTAHDASAEKAYRRGYHQGVWAVLDSLDRGATLADLQV